MLSFVLLLERDESSPFKYYPIQQDHQRVCEAVSNISASNVETLNLMNVVHKKINTYLDAPMKKTKLHS